ncbi:hypothetical protein QWZ13_04790 [Reinekea marina]|uniref:hypothetical protein n=1 Tax=Reinekea marina TaxID=1310421 RepID=UPI0025B356B2|nr:hypothetical protein [Reinekea marina]MDN3648223.1 hypothetical protein [Reinekea marina]
MLTSSAECKLNQTLILIVNGTMPFVHFTLKHWSTSICLFYKEFTGLFHEKR